ncbi:hypothetical protein [Tsuneonella dongtanensis]|nr:hypothetical protein [Tsuneonella dongtanensis]
MHFLRFAGALALAVVAVTAAPALADDPNDPTMRSAAAKARDRAIIKRLNQEQLRYVQQRDARLAAGNAASREWAAKENARRMATWRHAVRMCESGRHKYCAR